MLRVTREQYDVVIAMKLGLGSNRIAKGLGISHAAVLSRQNTLEKLGVISGGTMQGQRRRVLLPDSAFRVESEHRGTVRARAAADRAAAAARDRRLENLAKARAAKAARRGQAGQAEQVEPAEPVEPLVCPITPGCDCLVAI